MRDPPDIVSCVAEQAKSELRSNVSTPCETVRRMLRRLAVYGLAKRLRSVGTSVPGSAAQALGYSGYPSPDQYRVIAVEHLHGNQVSRRCSALTDGSWCGWTAVALDERTADLLEVVRRHIAVIGQATLARDLDC